MGFWKDPRIYIVVSGATLRPHALTCKGCAGPTAACPFHSIPARPFENLILRRGAWSWYSPVGAPGIFLSFE